MRIIGLTGGIATGKSTVVNMLRARGLGYDFVRFAVRMIFWPGKP